MDGDAAGRHAAKLQASGLTPSFCRDGMLLAVCLGVAFQGCPIVHGCVPGDAPGVPQVLQLLLCGETMHCSFNTCRLRRHAAPQ